MNCSSSDASAKWRSPVRRIVSGGQTGVDQGGLDAAIELQIEHGGWCPAGRICEEGVIPDRYQLVETESSDYAFRTRRNVIDSDATLILARGPLTGGTALTQRHAVARNRPHRVVDLDHPPSVENMRAWLSDAKIGVLNIAGPRESGAPGIRQQARDFLLTIFRT